MLTAVLPTTGSTNGNQTVTLTGTNFEVGATRELWLGAGHGRQREQPDDPDLADPGLPAGTVNVTIHNPGWEPVQSAQRLYVRHSAEHPSAARERISGDQ